MEREGRTTLIVDSSKLIRYYHGMLMQRLQYAVLTAPAPADALHLLKNMVPNLILTGLTFPHANGIDFIKTIKHSTLTKSVPVIAITSREDPGTKAACLEAGCAACLGKPAAPECLFWTVQDVSESTPRKFIRIKTSLPASIGDGADKEGTMRSGYVTSLSEGGIFLRTLSLLPKDDIAPVSIFVDGREIRAQAVVLYNISMEAGTFREPGMGMRFVALSEEDREYLRDFIHEDLTTDLEFCMMESKAAA